MKSIYTIYRLRLGSIMTMIFLVFLVTQNVTGQVNFTQTLNADFNKGVLNNVIVSGDNVSLQFAASGVGTWLTTTVLPQTLTGHKAVTWNNRFVYIVGGYNNLAYSSAVYVATIQTTGITGWTTLNPLPVPLKDPSVVVGTNTIYVMGGRDDTQIFNTIFYAAINYDGTIGAWQTSAVTLPAGLWGHTAVYLNGYIYVAGGSGSAAENTALNTVYYAKVKADNTLAAFTTGTNLPAARNKHSMVCYNSKLYLLGGYDNSGTRASTVYLATPGPDGSTGAWTAGTALPLAISNHSSVVTNGLIMVLAGENNTTLSNTVYFADADAGALAWTASTNVMYDFTKDGSAFYGNGLVFYSGGTNLSGTAIINCRYANLALTTNYVNHGVFVSNPYYELGAERLINSLTFNKTYTAPADLQVSYRTAPTDGTWGDWTALTGTSPIAVNLTARYLQYSVALTGSAALNSTLLDMTLTTPGTQLTGNLNATLTFTKALSPYWATSDISFTAGTHTFEAGATILFLPETGLTVSQANVICNGTTADSVKFLYFTEETGKWDGIYFDPNSDNSVSSQFYYTVIANAGFGGNNANLYCNQSNEPLLSRCSIRSADGNGIRLNSAHINLQNTVIRGNSENGAYLDNSNPTFVSCAISYNGNAGVFHTSPVSVPNFSASSTTIDHNLSALKFPSPNFTFYQPNGSPILTANTYNGIAMEGGDISNNQRWNTITYDYVLLGTVRIGAYSGAARLTIEPGNTIKVLSGNQLQIGIASSYGGELYALGTADSLITFTSHNGLSGGWNGIYFTDWSDNWGGVSQLDYCVIEKGNDYNYYSSSTNQPNLINNTIIRSAVQDGAWYNNAAGSITNCQFLTNGRYPVYFMNPEANPVHNGNTYTGNGINRFTLSGGTYSFNRTYNDDGVPYYILDNLIMAQYAGKSRLTLEPGVIMEFASGKKLQFGSSSSYGGELNAIGNGLDPIIFRAYSNASGGWEGIHFTPWNDDWGGTSIMEYCTIMQGSLQNILVEGSGQPTLNNCLISNSSLHGIVVYQSNPSIRNCTMSLNAGYPLKFNDWTCSSLIKNNTYSSNTLNYIALSGGDYDANRTIYYDGAPYHVLGNIRMIQYAGHSRLTVQPGVIMNFNPGIGIQLGWPSSYGGDLWAEGKSDSLIVFKPYNNLPGGWAGIYFSQWNDDWSGVSSMKYCVVEKGDTYNVKCIGSGQPSMDHCTMTNSTGDGLWLNNSSIGIFNSNFTFNDFNGILLEGSSNPTIGNDRAYTCNFYNNGLYALYNNTANNINARYNYWATGDSTMVVLGNYEKSKNAAKGLVLFMPFAQVPSLYTPTTTMGGTITYANTGANPIKNAAMVVENFGDTNIANTTSNTSGVYAFAPFTSGNYQMTITPAAPWGGVNATDALLILNHFAQITPLTGMNLAAADVNYSHTVNGTDALFVLKRWAGMITAFPAGDYLYHTDTLIVNGNLVTNDLKMICFGDVNASNEPAKKSSSPITLIHEGTLFVPSFTEFTIPVKVKSSLAVGAISLGLWYPEEYLEVTGVEMPAGKPGVVFSAEKGLFRMGWCDLVPMMLGADDILVTLKVMSKDLSGCTGGLQLELDAYSEFADPQANIAIGVVLDIPEIKLASNGTDMQFSGNLRVHPNPVTEQSRVSFSLPGESHVKVALFNLVGTHITTVTDAGYPSGSHQLELEAASLAPGIYLLKIEITHNGQTSSKTIKLVVSN